MKLYLVRHGESVGNTKQGFISGQTDLEGLSEKGRIQIIRTSWELRNESIEEIYSSPVARAQETAGILGSYLDKKIKTEKWLTELHHGIFEGYYWWEVIHKIPFSWRARREDFRTPYPEGESMEMLFKRVSEGFNKWLSKLKEDGTYVIVSHQAVITTIRYFLEHGDFSSMESKEKEEHFLKFLHEVKLDNGNFAKYKYNNGNAQLLEEVSSFEIVKPNKNSISFYAKEMLRVKKEPTAERMETASTNSVYMLTTPTPCLVKVIRDKDKKAFQSQISLYRYLNEKRIPSPHILSVDTNRVFFGDDVIVQDYVQGDVIKKCFLDHPEKVDDLLQKVFESLSQIHSLPVEEISTFWRPPLDEQFTNWKNYMLLNINMTLHVIQESEVEGETLTDIQDALACLKDYVREERYKLVPLHGDVGSDNVIVHHKDSCQLVRLIDFEWARIGDNLWDFAYFWGWIERDNEEVALKWKSILEKKLADQMIQLEWYRLLFHAWTVRDMIEYKEHPIRNRRGKKSLEILKRIQSK